MVYIVCLALLVVIGAWIVSSYSRFRHLYSQVQDSWNQWADVTRERNLRLAAFANLFSSAMPKDAMLPRDLRRLADDSGRALNALSDGLEPVMLQALGEAEKRLREAMSLSVSRLEQDEAMRANHRLLQLCSEMSVSMVRQDQFAHFYNRYAGMYNSALNSPSGRIFGPLMGFSPVERI